VSLCRFTHQRPDDIVQELASILKAYDERRSDV